MTYKKLLRVKNHKLVIDLPDSSFMENEEVLVIVDSADEEKEKKYTMMESASRDPLFLADVAEVVSDFENVENDI